MRKYADWGYKADEGKHFVLTEKGKAEWASYKHKEAGKPVNENDLTASRHEVETGCLIEVDDPNWIECSGFRVVYDHEGHQLPVGNAIVFPAMELAERYMQSYKRLMNPSKKMYIIETVYKGKRLKERREFNGKPVFNKSWWLSGDIFQIGDYVDEEIVNDIIDALPPACMRSDCSQLGEPYSDCYDERTGKWRATYMTFKRVGKDTWEYCGHCFRGENVEPKTEA